MKIRMITTAAGPDFSAQAGQSVDVSEAMGKMLVAGGFAVSLEPKISSEPLRETASIETPEITVRPKPLKKAVGKRGT